MCSGEINGWVSKLIANQHPDCLAFETSSVQFTDKHLSCIYIFQNDWKNMLTTTKILCVSFDLTHKILVVVSMFFPVSYTHLTLPTTPYV